MHPPTLDYRSPASKEPPERKYVLFTIIGVLCGIWATLVMLHDNTLWYTGPKYPIFYPATWGLCHLLEKSSLFWPVQLLGPMIEWLLYGFLTDRARSFLDRHFPGYEG